MLAGKPPRLPRAFQEVEYLESTGTQYINTQITNQGYSSEARVAWTAIGSARQLFGASDAGYWGLSASGYYEMFAASDVAAAVGRWDDVRFSAAKPSGGGSIRNLLINRQSAISDLYSSTNPAGIVYAFTINARQAYCCKMRLAYLKLWDDSNVMVRNLIPCYRKADNKPGLYDLITDAFFVNAGTGEFIVGSDV